MIFIKNVVTAYRNFGGLEPSDAITRYKQRREDDAHAPVGATEFDGSGEDRETKISVSLTAVAVTM